MVRAVSLDSDPVPGASAALVGRSTRVGFPRSPDESVRGDVGSCRHLLEESEDAATVATTTTTGLANARDGGDGDETCGRAEADNAACVVAASGQRGYRVVSLRWRCGQRLRLALRKACALHRCDRIGPDCRANAFRVEFASGDERRQPRARSVLIDW